MKAAQASCHVNSTVVIHLVNLAGKLNGVIVSRRFTDCDRNFPCGSSCWLSHQYFRDNAVLVSSFWRRYAKFGPCCLSRYRFPDNLCLLFFSMGHPSVVFRRFGIQCVYELVQDDKNWTEWAESSASKRGEGRLQVGISICLPSFFASWLRIWFSFFPIY